MEVKSPTPGLHFGLKNTIGVRVRVKMVVLDLQNLLLGYRMGKGMLRYGD